MRLTATCSPATVLDGLGNDKTCDMPAREASKVWSKRSIKELADAGAVPAGLPLGLSEPEKKLWLAIYMRARELLNGEQDVDSPFTVRTAVDDAIVELTEKHSPEFRFAMRWSHSVKSCKPQPGSTKIARPLPSARRSRSAVVSTPPMAGFGMRQDFRSSDVYS